MKKSNFFKRNLVIVTFVIVNLNVYGQVVISQVYGGGGNANAAFKNDFIELYNRGTSEVSLNGWSVQYTGGNGTTWSVQTLQNMTINPGQYILIQEYSSGSTGNNLPASDVSGTINISATAGKVALVNGVAALAASDFTGTNPTGSSIVDFVGFGTTATNYKTGKAPAPSNTNSIVRLSNGCTETNNNSTDFIAAAANPRNSSNYQVVCSTPTIQASNITFSSISTNSMTVNWTNGDGTNRAVFIKEGLGTILDPINGTTYIAKNDWNEKGTSLGNSGYYCVYNGTDNSVNLINLTPNTTYTIQIFEYFGKNQTSNYLRNTAQNNPKSETTLSIGTPIITVLETSFPILETDIGSASTQKINISGLNLTSDISLALTGADAGLFSLSANTVAQTSGTAANTEVAITYSPVAVGSHTATLTLTSSGASDIIRVINGTAKALPTPSDLSFGVTAINKVVGDAKFSNSASSLNGTTVIEYSSTNTAVATVESATGEVTIVGVGTTTISANQAAGTHNSLFYTIGTASYLLTVSPASIISVLETSLPAFETAVGSISTQKINISGLNLTSDISLALTGTDAGLFSLSANTVTQTSGTAANTEIAITYSPVAVGSHTATLTLASSGASNIIRILNGTASTTTELNNTKSLLNISVGNGCVKFLAANGELIEIYNAMGQKLVSQLAQDGINTIAISIHGVISVKVGTHITKVIL